MTTTTDIAVREVDAASTYDLRRRVLRNHLPGLPVAGDCDDAPDTVHLGAYRDDRLLGVITVIPEAAPGRPGRRGRRFRFMAVEPGDQRGGIGSALIAAVTARARDAGDEVLWANGRDGALDFYRKLGFAVLGDGFVDEVSQLPHHLVMLDL